jgi:hypothetical protein
LQPIEAILLIVIASAILALITGIVQRRRRGWPVVAWLAGLFLLAVLVVVAAMLFTVASGSMG